MSGVVSVRKKKKNQDKPQKVKKYYCIWQFLITQSKLKNKGAEKITYQEVWVNISLAFERRSIRKELGSLSFATVT